MQPKHPKTATLWRVAARISLAYALVASIWIYASDRLLAQFADCPPALIALQTYKGWGFVAVTTALLYGLIGHLLTRAYARLPAADPGETTRAESASLTPALWQGARTPLLIFLALASAIGSIGYLAYRHQQQALQTAKADELRGIADDKVAELSHWLSERRRDAEFIARDPFIRRAVGRWLFTPPPPADEGQLLERWLTHLQATFAYAAVLLLDAEGQLRLGVGATQLQPQQQALVRQALASGQVVLSELHWRQEGAGSPIDLDLMVPVQGVADGQPPLGALVLQIDSAQSLFPLIQTWPTASPSAETLLVRREGEEVVYLNELRHRQGTALQLRVPLTSERLPAARAVRGERGVIEGLDYRQVPVLAALRPVPTTPWFLVAKVDAEEVEAPLRTLALWVAVVGSLLIIAAGAGTALWWRQQHAGFVAERLRRELERQALTQRFDYLSKYANDSILLMDSQGQLLEANDRAVATYGYSHEELLHLNLRDLRAPETQLPATAEMAQVARSDGLVFETVHRRQDGTCFPVEVSARPIEIEGQPFLQSIIRDITERKHYEAQLAEAERFARATLDALPAHLCVLDETGTILRVNQAWRAFAQANGADPARVSEGSNYLAVCAAARGPCSEGAVFFAEGLRAVLRGVRRQFSLEYPAPSPSEPRWFCATVTAFQASSPTRLVITHENITALKQAEAKLAEQKDLLSNILNQAADIIIACDTQGRFTLINTAARRLALQDPAGKRLDDSVALWGERYHPDGRPVAQQEWALRKALQGITTVGAETRIVRPDGSHYDALVSAAPVRNAYQAIIGAVATFSDITQRKQTENALRESAARLRAIINAVPDLLLVLDEDGRYLEALTTQPYLLYTEPATFQGKLMSEVLPAELAHQALHTIRQTLRTGHLQTLEYALHIAKAGQRYFEARATPLDLPKANKPAVMVLVRDITARRLTEESLRQAQKMEAVGQLTGGVAHDFNNLLGIILGNLDLLAEALDQPELQDLVRRSVEAAERGTALVQRLLAFARRQPLQAKPVDLNQLVAGMTDLLQRTLGETIQVQTVLAEDLAQVVVDASQFETALLNLALNARDAMPNGGRLTLETANSGLDEDYAAVHQPLKPGPYVLLAVSDTGSGMPPEVLEHAFEPFFTTKEVGKGSGLGLSMVYGLVKQSQGHIQLYSEVGQGTTIKIYLPPRAVESHPALAARASEVPLPAGQGQTILVVEDEPPVRQLAVSMLHSLGYQTVDADTAARALQVLEATPQIGLLFTDIVLPGGMNGIDLARAAQQRRPDLKVLFTSGYTDYHLASLSRHLQGGIEWLSKPYRKSQLAIKLHALLDPRAP